MYHAKITGFHAEKYFTIYGLTTNDFSITFD